MHQREKRRSADGAIVVVIVFVFIIIIGLFSMVQNLGAIASDGKTPQPLLVTPSTPRGRGAESATDLNDGDDDASLMSVSSRARLGSKERESSDVYNSILEVSQRRAAEARL